MELGHFEADTDGKNFVFSFQYPIGRVLDETFQASVVIIPLKETSARGISCKIHYSALDKTSRLLHMAIISGYYNEIPLNTSDVVRKFKFNGNSVQPIDDTTIRIACDENVKVIAKMIDINYGDIFLVPETSMAGKDYIVQLPNSIEYENHIISISSIKGDFNGFNYAIYKNGHIIESGSNGGKNNSLTDLIIISDVEVPAQYTVVISSDREVVLTVMSPQMSPSLEIGKCENGECGSDLGIYIAQPSASLNCNAWKTFEERKMMDSEFSAVLAISPPLKKDCSYQFGLIHKKSTQDIIEDNSLLETMGLRIDMEEDEQMFLSSKDGSFKTVRFGGIRTNYTNNLIGSFMHFVPSINEYITGETIFHLPNYECVLEVYTTLDTFLSDCYFDSEKLDSKLTSVDHFADIEGNYIKMILNLHGYIGIHDFFSPGKYISYVICKNVGGPNTAIGYVTGFDKIKA
uniref:IgGFc_binding domain-containing protein n=1 Tax=Rhabditophanes sp. KR3021 TaxID=114890 RepID=A0AC35TFZ7_9BILA